MADKGLARSGQRTLIVLRAAERFTPGDKRLADDDVSWVLLRLCVVVGVGRLSSEACNHRRDPRAANS